MGTVLDSKWAKLFLVSVLVLSVLCNSGCVKKGDDIAASSENITSGLSEAIESSVNTTIEVDIPETNNAAKKEITVDFYKVPEMYSNFITDEEFEFYNKFVTAWLDYEPVVEVENPEVLGHVWGMVQECFFVAYGDLDMESGYDVVGNTVYLHYLSDSKEEHDEIVRQFKERVQFFFEDIDADVEGVDLAYQLYVKLNSTVEYSYFVVDSDNFTYENSSGYAALMRGEGVCMSFSKAYAYLLRQAGIEAFYVSGSGHAWGAIEVDEKYYFVDPTWNYVNEPAYYYYFCFGLDRREEDGYLEDSMYLCCSDDFRMSDYVQIERENYTR